MVIILGVQMFNVLRYPFVLVASTAVLGVIAAGVFLLVILLAIAIVVGVCYWKRKGSKYQVLVNRALHTQREIIS